MVKEFQNKIESTKNRVKYFAIKKQGINISPHFICPYCGISLSYFHTLKRHIKEKHTSYNKIKCCYCGNMEIPFRIKEHFYKCHKFIAKETKSNKLINNNSFSLLGASTIKQLSSFEHIKRESIFDVFENMINNYKGEISLLYDKYYIFNNFKIDEGSFGKINFGITKDKKYAIAIKNHLQNKYQKQAELEFENLRKLQKYEYFFLYFSIILKRKIKLI